MGVGWEIMMSSLKVSKGTMAGLEKRKVQDDCKFWVWIILRMGAKVKKREQSGTVYILRRKKLTTFPIQVY